MAYLFYVDRVLLPVTPAKLQMKIKGKNSVATLINEGDINILKKAGLTEVSFEAMLPNTLYPFAQYASGYQTASYFLEKLEALKLAEQPFQFIVTREKPSGGQMYATNLTVSLEDYSVTEDAKNGLDVMVSISLKQYKPYGTKTCVVTFVDDTATAEVTENRESDSSVISIGSDVIVNGQLHTSSYGEGPGQMRSNYRGKINFIKDGRSHPYHVTTPEGGWLGWVTASSVQGV